MRVISKTNSYPNNYPCALFGVMTLLALFGIITLQSDDMSPLPINELLFMVYFVSLISQETQQESPKYPTYASIRPSPLPYANQYNQSSSKEQPLPALPVAHAVAPLPMGPPVVPPHHHRTQPNHTEVTNSRTQPNHNDVNYSSIDFQPSSAAHIVDQEGYEKPMPYLSRSNSEVSSSEASGSLSRPARPQQQQRRRQDPSPRQFFKQKRKGEKTWGVTGDT